VKKPTSQVFHARLDVERPECAKLIGAIAMAWSFLEQVLALHFASVVMGAKGGSDGNIYQIALEAFDANTTISQRKEMFLVAARRRFDEPVVEGLAKILGKTVDLARRRNRVIHGRWRVSPEHPKSLLYERRIGEGKLPEIYGPAQLSSILSAILKHYEEFNAFFFQELLPRLGTGGPHNLGDS
jgi:hypothetical protein